VKRQLIWGRAAERAGSFALRFVLRFALGLALAVIGAGVPQGYAQNQNQPSVRAANVDAAAQPAQPAGSGVTSTGSAKPAPAEGAS